MPRIAPSLFLSFAILSLAACQPRDHRDQEQQQAGQQHPGVHIRKACADEISKYCQTADRKKRCLRENMDKLGAECKAALEAARARRRDKLDKTDKTDNGGD